MAEFNFLGSWDDTLEVLRKLSQLNRFTFYLEKFYPEPQPVAFRDLNENVIKSIEERPWIFVWSDEHSLFPPHFFQYKDGIMSIDFEHSGPAIDIKLPRIHNNKGRMQLGSGWIFTPPKFFDPITSEPYKLSSGFLQDCNLVKKTIQSCLTKRYIPSRKITTQGNITPIVETLWIGKDGLTKMESGNIFIHLYDEWIGIGDLKERKEDVALDLSEYENE